MIHRITLLAAMLLVLASSPLPAQRWREMWTQPGTYQPLEVKAAFDAYYATHSPQKGDGYKQFQRYWYDVGRRLGPQGEYVNAPLRAYEARRSIEQARPPEQARTSVNDGNWYDISADIGHFYNGTLSAVGRVSVVAFHPTQPNTFYIGTPTAGIWRTTNHGSSWTPLTSDEPFWGVCALTVDPNNGNILYAITGDDFGATKCTGLYKSTDAGTTWVAKNPALNFSSNFYSARKIMVDPTNSSIVYAAIAGISAGLYKSTNGGDAWTRIYGIDNPQDFELHPSNANIIYLCDTQNAWRSTDGGSTWSNSVLSFYGNTNAVRLAVSPAGPNYVYAFAGGPSPNGTFPGLYRSTNAGLNWTLRSSTPNVQEGGTGNGSATSSWWSLGLAVNPTNANIVHVGSLQEWSSNDGGLSWTVHDKMDPMGGSIDDCHSDCHVLIYNNGKLYYGNDGGIYYSANEGTKWTDISNGLHITDIYKTSSTEMDPCMVLFGAQEASSNLMRGPFPTEVMTLVSGGDGMDNAIDPLHPNILYTCQQLGGNLAYNTNSGADPDFENMAITPDSATAMGPGAWVTPIQLNPLKNTSLLAGYTHVGVHYRALFGTWVNLSSGKIADTTVCTDVKFAPSDTLTIYVTKADSIFRTTNYGTTWSNITNNIRTLGGWNFANIVVNPTNKQHVFVACASWLTNKKVFESTNGGTTWTNISGTGLPNVPTNCLVYQAGTSDGLYLGTDAGVFYRDDLTGAWLPFSDGLPYVAVNDLDIVYTTKKLRAATTGRGMWETNLRGVTRSEFLNLTGSTTATLENEAYGQISSNQVLNSPANVTYRSATGVLLTTGFRVNGGAKFLGTVSPCMAILAPESTTALPPLAADPPQPDKPLPKEFRVSLAPNPTDKQVTLHIALPSPAAFRIEVFDLSMRRIVVRGQEAAGAGLQAYELPTDDWPAGTYLVQVSSGKDIQRLKLVVQH